MSPCTEAADYSLVELRIPHGDRPDMKEIDQEKAEGMKELVGLMKKCWHENPSERPNSKGIVALLLTRVSSSEATYNSEDLLSSSSLLP